MANESAAGRDGWIFAMGQRFYHVYKQSFPMEFWYGLTPDANREDSRNLIDVRTLPEKYRHADIEVSWTKVPKRSFAKRAREQLNAHALTFANAIVDGYNLSEHVERENQRAAAEWAEYQAKREAEIKTSAAAGLCVWCGGPCGDECEMPF